MENLALSQPDRKPPFTEKAASPRGAERPESCSMSAPHGRPSFADSQEETILAMLREAGPRGVSKAFLIFECHFTQAGALVFELERRGYKIRHEMRPGDQYVTFVLESSPEAGKPEPSEPEWKDRPRVTGLPLFDMAVRQ